MSMNNDPEFVEYTIQSNDTLWDIAEDYDISVEDIIEANADLDPDNLYVGQVIYLPSDLELDASQRPFDRERDFGPGRRPFRRRRPFACRRFYRIRPGDTIYRLSFRFGVPVRRLVRANPNIDFGFPLQVGDTICIPF